MCLKSGNAVSSSLYTSSQSIHYTAFPPIKATLYWYAYAVSLPVYRIQIAMKYYFNADNHACTYALVLVNGFGLANLIDITTLVVVTSYSCYQAGSRVSYSYSVDILAIPYCIVAVSCIYTLL